MEYVSSCALMTLSVGTILYGARASYRHPPGKGGRGDASSHAEEHSQTITMWHALMFPVVGSATLLTLYLAFKYVDWLLVLYILAMSTGAVSWAIAPLVSRLLPDGGCCKLSKVAVTGGLSLFTTLWWATSGHYVPNNVIGVSLCIAIMSTLKLPGLKVAAIALLGLLIYDAYWVFLSPAHFDGKSVMVEVATQQATNPIATVVDALPEAIKPPPQYFPAPKLSLPNKLALPVYMLLKADPEIIAEAAGAGGTAANGIYVFDFLPLAGSMLLLVGQTFLGLGDIALPGTLLALAHKIDMDKQVMLEEEGQHSETTEGTKGDEEAANGGPDSDGMPEDSEDAAEDAPLNRQRQSVGAPPAAGTGLQLRRGMATASASPSTATAPTVPATHVRSKSEGSDMNTLPDAAAAQLASSAANGGSTGRCGGLREIIASTYGGIHATLSSSGYLRTGFIGYIVGLVMAVTISRYFHAAQPALIYLVPCTLGPLLVRAYRQRELKVLWEGQLVAASASSGSSSSAAPAADAVMSDPATAAAAAAVGAVMGPQATTTRLGGGDGRVEEGLR